ncbi:unnamed protein product [Sympodiomycopsis kandeliae]
MTSTTHEHETEPVIIIGSGLAGLVAAYEITRAKQKVIIVEQENEANLGGQAFWSLGGIFLIDSPEQRRWGIKDSLELAKRDWYGSASWDRLDDQDEWGKKWADAYLEFAAGEKREYLRKLGMGYVPTPGWAERGGGVADGHGNSVPRFHLTWGTGPEVLRVFRDPVLKAGKEEGLVEWKFRHQVDSIVLDDQGKAVGVKGQILEPFEGERGIKSTRTSVGTFSLSGRAVIVAAGGIGGNVDLVKQMWPKERFSGHTPENFVVGVPAHVDGRMVKISQEAGARLVNKDRFWHYTEGLSNWNPIWPGHGIRVIPGPTSLWLDATGKRLPPPCYPGCDSLATLKHICSTGYDYTWFVLNQSIAYKEFGLSGSEQNPDVTNKSYLGLLSRLYWGPEPVRAFQKHGKDWVTAANIEDLVKGMNEVVRKDEEELHQNKKTLPKIDVDNLRTVITDRDIQVDNNFTKDTQIMLIKNAKSYKGEPRTVKLHKILDPAYGPLIAVKMNLLTRKTLGGLQTNLDSQCFDQHKQLIPGLYAVGEIAGFGGGGVHGHNALEGTFLGGCIFSGRNAGLALAKLGKEEQK